MDSYSPRMNNAAKKALAETVILSAIRSAGEMGQTPAAIASITHVGHKTLLGRLADLRARGAIHIALWRVQARHLMPAFVLGQGEDADRDAYLHLLEEVDIEREINQETRCKHARWASNWRPHRPPEAAWIL